MKDRAALILEEHARARQLLDGEVDLLVVILNPVLRALLFSERHMIVGIEIRTKRRDPRKAPAHASLEWLDIGVRRVRDRPQRHIAMSQVNRHRIEVVGQIGTALAALDPSRPHHEVIDDKLAAPVEEIGESLFAARPLEDILLLHALPRQLAPLAAQLIAQPRELLFFGKKLLARFCPLFMRYLVMLHGRRCCRHREPPLCQSGLKILSSSSKQRRPQARPTRRSLQRRLRSWPLWPGRMGTYIPPSGCRLVLHKQGRLVCARPPARRHRNIEKTQIDAELAA